MAMRYLPFDVLETCTRSSFDEQGRPELLKAALPSALSAGMLTSEAVSRVKECERQLRRVACLKALQTVRAVSVQSAHMLRGKDQHTRGVVGVTRAEVALTRLAARLTYARWLYTSSRA